MNWSEEELNDDAKEIYIIDQFGVIQFRNCPDNVEGVPDFGAHLVQYLKSFAGPETTEGEISALCSPTLFAPKAVEGKGSTTTRKKGVELRGAIVSVKSLKNSDSSGFQLVSVIRKPGAAAIAGEPAVEYLTRPALKDAGCNEAPNALMDARGIGTDLEKNWSPNRISRTDPLILETLLETLPDGVFLKDGEGRWQIVNSVAKKIFGIADDSWIGKSDWELSIINPNMAAVHRFCAQSDEAAWQRRDITHCLECAPDVSGKMLYYDTIKMPLFHGDGSRKSIVVVARDITEKKKMDDENSYDQHVQHELNKILKISLQDFPLDVCLDGILNIVIHAPIVNLLPQGRIFLREDDSDKLILASHQNFTLSADSKCGSIEFGKCVCGNAASLKKAVYWDGIHDVEGIVYQGAERAAHYAIPIISGGETLGVLLVCIEIGHQQNQKEILFLESVADILAGLINRKKAEQHAISSYTFLENLDKVNSVIQSSLSKGTRVLELETVKLLIQIFSADFASIISGFGKGDSRCRLRIFGSGRDHDGAVELDTLVPRTEAIDALKSYLTVAGESVLFTDTSLMPEVVADRAGADALFLGIALIGKSDRPKLLLLRLRDVKKNMVKEKRLVNMIAERFSNSLNTLYLLNEVRLREETYKTLAETAKDIIVSYGPDGKLTYLNSVGMEFFGVKETDFLGKSIFGFLPPEEVDKVMGALRDRSLGNHGFKILELNLRNAEGTIVPFESNSAPVITNGVVTGIVAFIRNIAERKNAEEKLIRQNRELKVINEELDRFVYSTSHDLRAPLTSVLGLIGLARDSHSDPDELHLYLDMMEKSIARLDTVIKNILDYSKTNRLKPSFEPIDVMDIYKAIISGVGYILHANNFNLVTEIDSTVLFESDRAGITTIMSNLITNAVKYRRKDVVPYVKVGFFVEAGYGILTVEDNGEGIPESKFDRIFEMFYRNSSTADGSGLGLYIVRQNIIRLSGTIDIESEVGRGTKFTVRIPNQRS